MYLTEGKIIKNKLLIYGFEKGRMPMELNKDIINVGRLLLNLPPNKNIENDELSKKEVLKLAKEFIETHLCLHDIPYLTEEQSRIISSQFSPGGLILPDKLDELCEELKNGARMISPLELPITYLDGHSMFGQLKKSIIIIPDNEFSKKEQVSFEKVILGDNITRLTPATYLHEITHTQLESIKGSTLNYHNKEILPILIEKIVALELDPTEQLLRKSELMRFRDLLEKISNLYSPDNLTRTELLEESVYVTSTLKAQNLFDKYLYGDKKTKEEMLSQIQSIFDGYETVEEFLEKNDVTLENSTDIKMIKSHL